VHGSECSLLQILFPSPFTRLSYAPSHLSQDQFDVIDFSDNDIKKLDNFPAMQRLNALLLHNNSISRIGAGLGEHLPKLTTVMLTNNRVANMSEIDHLAQCKLESLSLLDNPVAAKAQYRLYVIYKIPTLKWLDFRKVQQTEREESAKFFKTPAGKAFLSAVAQEAKFLSEGGANGHGEGRASAPLQLSEEQKVLVKKAIEQATTREEIDNIERQLKVSCMFTFLRAVAGECTVVHIWL
jgi:U2 small nuclear ribonucleoprotein A'